jgi:hypothetical protein
MLILWLVTDKVAAGAMTKKGEGGGRAQWPEVLVENSGWQGEKKEIVVDFLDGDTHKLLIQAEMDADARIVPPKEKVAIREQPLQKRTQPAPGDLKPLLPSVCPVAVTALPGPRGLRIAKWCSQLATSDPGVLAFALEELKAACEVRRTSLGPRCSPNGPS